MVFLSSIDSVSAFLYQEYCINWLGSLLYSQLPSRYRARSASGNESSASKYSGVLYGLSLGKACRK
uniref:Terminase large subunit n=1 Tax=uncultured marine virus TaxID=186617 RepID=A0A0F7L4T7_9VIRU|nr:terminase large subunit [uncultured marine virus]